MWGVALAALVLLAAAPPPRAPRAKMIVRFPDAAPATVAAHAARHMASAPNRSVLSVRHRYVGGFHGFAGDLTTEGVAHFEALGATIIEDTRVTTSAIVWGIDRINQASLPLDDDYTVNNHGEGTHIYILDTGINSAHVEFTGRVGNGYDFVDNDSDPEDCNGHGTHGICSGSGDFSTVLSANNNNLVNNIITNGLPIVVAAGKNGEDACNYSPGSATSAITVGASVKNDAGAFSAGTLVPAEVWDVINSAAVLNKLSDSTSPSALPGRNSPNKLLQPAADILFAAGATLAAALAA
ncbi:peptidase S8/S53 domain-containing protein [Pavlovales sp. CCMP2436]|nr:peptidase S8/S53 domain-containing protein [Pavlovales sp. CCMP2436]